MEDNTLSPAESGSLSLFDILCDTCMLALEASTAKAGNDVVMAIPIQDFCRSCNLKLLKHGFVSQEQFDAGIVRG